MRRPESSRLPERQIAAKHVVSGVLKRLRNRGQKRCLTISARSMRQHQRPGMRPFGCMEEAGQLAVTKWLASGHRVLCNSNSERA